MRNFFLYLPMLLAINITVGSCKKDHHSSQDDQYAKIKPSKPKPSWAPNITAQMQTVIEALDSLAPTPITALTPQQARMQPGAADAAMQVMNNFGIAAPAVHVDTAGKDIPVEGAMIHVRIYTPKTGKSTYPVIVYYHGGGWVIATNDTYDASAVALSEKTDAVLIAVEYRKGPEFKFPTAHNDAYDAYVWALQNAAGIKGDSTKIFLAGESAGGNMAIATAIKARDNGLPLPLRILSVYPVASNDLTTASKIQYKAAKPLGTPALPWFLMHYLNNETESSDPRISLVNADLAGLPAVTIIGAEIDPLQTEGKILADKLAAAGVSTTYRLYNGVTHEFFGMDAVIPEAKDAQKFAAMQLKMAL